MVKAVNKNIVLKVSSVQEKSLIYIPTKTIIYEVISVGDEVKSVKNSDLVILEKEPILYSIDGVDYYFTNESNVMAKMEGKDE